MLITSDIHSQQNLNTPKEELRITHRPTVDFSFGEWFVEKPLRKYILYIRILNYPFIKSTFFQPSSTPL